MFLGFVAVGIPFWQFFLSDFFAFFYSKRNTWQDLFILVHLEEDGQEQLLGRSSTIWTRA